MARKHHPRRRRHRRGLGILYKLLSVLLISAAIVVALIMFFKVDEITVSGGTSYSADEVIAASGIEIGENLFLLNKYEISDAIIEKLPYVSSVSIRRKLPNTLQIQIADSNQGGVIQQGGAYWVVSSEGKLLGKRSEVGSGAQISGILLENPEVGKRIHVTEDNSHKCSQMLELFAALDQKGMLPGVKSIDFTRDDAISMEYADRFTVKFPYGADFTNKLSQLSQVIEKLEEQEDMRSGVLDLTGDSNRVHFIPG